MTNLYETLDVNFKRGDTTLLVREERDRNWRVLNRINPTSKFKNTKAIKENFPMNQMASEGKRVAQSIADGWRQCGPWQNPEFRIVQVDVGGVDINEERV